MSSQTRTANKQTSYDRGIAGEAAALAYLQECGFDILRERYKTKYGEIDIIARRDTVLCFVEVKLRTALDDALHSITKRARGRIEQSALFFLSEYPQYMHLDMRFDVIALVPIVDDKLAGGFSVTHLDNAWEAGA